MTQSRESSRSVRIRNFGAPAVLSIENVAVPSPGDGEILLRVLAASVNPVDLKLRMGAIPFFPSEGLPYSLGGDFVGVVEEIGTGVDSRFSLGDRVYGLTTPVSGAQSDYLVVDAAQVTHAPKAIDAARAAALPVAAITAWQGLFDHGDLQAGQSVLVHGGAGGVGHLAIQFAKQAGATVLTTCSADDFDFVRALGADVAIDYKNQRFEDFAEDVDVVLCLIGGDTQDRSWDVIRQGGIFVSTIGGSDPGRAAAAKVRTAPPFMAQPNSGQLDQIAALVDAGKINVVVSETYPLHKIAEAHDRLEKGRVRGKIVLVME